MWCFICYVRWIQCCYILSWAASACQCSLYTIAIVWYIKLLNNSMDYLGPLSAESMECVHLIVLSAHCTSPAVHPSFGAFFLHMEISRMNHSSYAFESCSANSIHLDWISRLSPRQHPNHHPGTHPISWTRWSSNRHRTISSPQERALNLSKLSDRTYIWAHL